MTDSVTHRGPDEVGYFHDDLISLGHARLSIIDLHTGSQPMFNENKNREKNYIRLGEDTPIIERPLQIVIRRQFIKNKRAKDKAWSSLTMRLRE